LGDYSQVLFERPGIWKDLKTMGSVSLSIFFITLLVLGRQVRLLMEEQIQKRAGGDRDHGEPEPRAAGERASRARG
ncbi:ADCY2 isoform 5, partial [Pan troglodytes]